MEGAEYPVGKLAKTEILEFDRTANPYKLSWNKVDYAYQYKVRVNIYSSKSGGEPGFNIRNCGTFRDQCGNFY